jgi:hypothetical protein
MKIPAKVRYLRTSAQPELRPCRLGSRSAPIECAPSHVLHDDRPDTADSCMGSKARSSACADVLVHLVPTKTRAGKRPARLREHPLLCRIQAAVPRADRVSLTFDGLATPSVDHLSNKGTLNVLLDRPLAGLPTGRPPDRTMVRLFINFRGLPTRRFDSTTRLALSCSSSFRHMSAWGRAPTCARSTTWRTASVRYIGQC